MAQLVINVGTAPNDGLGDPIRTAYQKCNTNFSELYSRAQTTPPPTLVGSVGDFAGMYAYDSAQFYYCFGDYDGSSVIWAVVDNAGNVSATNITNGNSNVRIGTSGGNVTVGVTGVANVAVFTPTSLVVTGRISASGNVVGANLFTSGNVETTGNIVGNTISSTTTMQLAVFANTAVRDSSISSPQPGMMIYITGTGMQVRGATSWNTVAGTGT